MKTALVTGASKGIGLEIARQLGERGFEVWIGARNHQAGEQAAALLRKEHITARFVLMDVGDLDSIQKVFHLIKPEIEQLDVLVNNAGVSLDETTNIVDVSADAVYQTIHINALGALFVTQVFAPLLKKGSRVINVSSGAGEIGEGMGSYAPVYSISKTAMNAVTCQFAHAFRRKDITVNSVCPGWVRTDMGGKGAPRSVRKGAETPVWLATEAPINETGKFWRDKAVIPW